MTPFNFCIIIYTDGENGSIFLEDFRNLDSNDTEYKIQEMIQDEKVDIRKWLEHLFLLYIA